MNKTIVLLAGLFCAGATADAQKIQPKAESPARVYFRGGLGYAAPHGGSLQGPLYVLNNTELFPQNGSLNVANTPTNTSRTYDLNKVSFSSGLQGILALGINLTEHLGVELNANVALATKEMKTNIKIVQTQTTTDIVVRQQSNKPLTLGPSLVVQTGGKVNVYARGGVVFPVLASITQDIDYRTSTFNPADSNYVVQHIGVTENYYMRIVPGVSGAMGVQLKVGRGVTMWGEFGLLSMNLYYKKSEVTAYSEDGVSYLNQLSPSQRLSTYEYKGTVSGNNNLPTVQVPFSNFSINLGVKVDIE